MEDKKKHFYDKFVDEEKIDALEKKATYGYINSIAFFVLFAFLSIFIGAIFGFAAISFLDRILFVFFIFFTFLMSLSMVIFCVHEAKHKIFKNSYSIYWILASNMILWFAIVTLIIWLSKYKMVDGEIVRANVEPAYLFFVFAPLEIGYYIFCHMAFLSPLWKRRLRKKKDNIQ